MTRKVDGLLVTNDGDLQPLQLTDEPGEPLYQQLQKVVGGYFEAVAFGQPRGLHLFVDEDGMQKGLPFNATLSGVVDAIAGRTGATLLGQGVFIGVSSNGETVSLSPEQTLLITNAYKQVVNT